MAVFFLQPSKTNSLQRLVGQTGLAPPRAVGSRHVAGVVSLSTVAVLAGTGGKTQTRARLTRRTMTAKRRPTLCGENVCLPRARGQDSGRDDCTDFGRIRNPSEPELTGGCRWWWWLMARLKDGLFAKKKEIVLFCDIFKGTIWSYENAKLKYLLNYKQAYVCWFDTTNFNNSKIKRIIIESVGHMTFHG